MTQCEKLMQDVEIVEPETCCGHAFEADTSRLTIDEHKYLRKSIKKAYKAQKMLNEAIKRLEASQMQEKKQKPHKKHHKSRSSSSSSNSSSNTSTSASSSSSSSSNDSDVELIAEQTVKPSKRHHGRKPHHGRRNRRGRDRSRSRSHSRGRSHGLLRGHSRQRSRGHSRGHSRDRSRGHSRGHSKTRDQQMCQFTRFFRGASLPTAPTIQQYQHTRSHIRAAATCSPQLDDRCSNARQHNCHDKQRHAKHEKNKKHKEEKKGKKHCAEHGEYARERLQCKDLSHSRCRSHSRTPSHSPVCLHCRAHRNTQVHGQLQPAALSFARAKCNFPVSMCRCCISGWPLTGYPYIDAFSDIPTPLEYWEHSGHRRRACSVPGRRK